tara:strand:- start:11136 stop:13589 length:2454 start_codon:yes stop_codon:yes gene_type:complete
MNFFNRIILSFLIFSFAYINSVNACEVERLNKRGNEVLGTPYNFKSYQSFAELNKYKKNSSHSLQDDITGYDKCSVWEVFSLRDQNKIYRKPTLIESDLVEVSKCSFKEKLFVVDIKGNWLKIKKSKKSEAIGWMHAEDLIFCSYAPVNEFGSTKKAIVIKSITNLLDMSDSERVAAIKADKYYADENLKIPTGQTLNKFEFLFILKEDLKDGNFLVSSSDKIIDGKEIKGWVNPAQIQLWDNRICYELNSSNRAYRAYGDTSLPIFTEPGALRVFKQKWKFPTYGILKKVKLKGRRDYAEVMRMPIVPKDGESSSISRIATFAGLVKSGGGTTVGDDDIEDAYYTIQKELGLWRAKKKNLNIVLLVDGTASMRSYKQKISSIVRYINEAEGNSLNIKIGMVVYRAKQEDVLRPIEKFPLVTPPYRSIINGINSLIFDSSEQEYAENVFKGLTQAINMFENDSSTNVIAHVGDCGNYHFNEIEEKMNTISKSFYEKKINYVGIQTQNFPSRNRAYRHFILQIKNIINGSLPFYVANVYKTTGSELDVVDNVNNEKITWSGKPSALYPVVTSFSYKDGYNELGANDFYEALKEGINTTIVEADKYINNLEDLLELYDRPDTIKPGEEFDEDFYDLLISQGFSRKALDLLLAESEICGEGYIQNTYYGINEPFLKKVVYMSLTWKEQVLDPAFDKFDKINPVGHELKDELYQAFIELAKAFYGEKEPIINIEGKTVRKIWTTALGINFYGDENIAQKTIAQLKDGISESEARAFATDLQYQINTKWKGSSFTNDKTLFYKFDQPFLWVPIEYFPFSEPY